MGHEQITQVEFDKYLRQILSETKAIELLTVAGIYEIVSEEFNNEVIDRWEQDNI